MKIVLAPDSFKGSLSAESVCDALQTGLKRVLPAAEIVRRPMADGGEERSMPWSPRWRAAAARAANRRW